MLIECQKCKQISNTIFDINEFHLCFNCNILLCKKTKTFIEKAIDVYGDKYNYSLVKYVNNNTTVRIICNIHGEFKQTPNSHLYGSNCIECSNNVNTTSIYDYNIIVDKNSKDEVVSIPKINTNYHKETKIKLQQLLNTSISNKRHTETILTLPTLKDAHIYCKCNNLSSQFTGPVLEKYINITYKMTKNNASSCNGDLKCNEINVEIKASNGGKENNKFNFVQLRMNHNCDYIFSAYYLDYTNLDHLGELYIFKLTKENIKLLIVKYGSYAHGTIGRLGEITMENLNDTNNTKEYALRPKYGDKCWNEILNFRIDEIII